VDVGAITDRDHWSFRFEAPQGQALGPGDYPQTRRIDIDQERPELDYSGRGRGNSQVSGHFVVWEVEFAENAVKRLAVDFVAEAGSPLYGMIRYNSTFE
jgi:hypothetical protein